MYIYVPLIVHDMNHIIRRTVHTHIVLTTFHVIGIYH